MVSCLQLTLKHRVQILSPFPIGWTRDASRVWEFADLQDDTEVAQTSHTRTPHTHTPTHPRQDPHTQTHKYKRRLDHSPQPILP